MDWAEMQVLKASIIELQELIHEHAKKMERTNSPDEFDRIEAELKTMWELNQERAFRYRGNSDSGSGDY